MFITKYNYSCTNLSPYTEFYFIILYFILLNGVIATENNFQKNKFIIVSVFLLIFEQTFYYYNKLLFIIFKENNTNNIFQNRLLFITTMPFKLFLTIDLIFYNNCKSLYNIFTYIAIINYIVIELSKYLVVFLFFIFKHKDNNTHDMFYV